MPGENVEFLRHLYEMYERRVLLDAHRRRVADDFVMHMRPEFPTQEAYGIDEIQEFWTELDETFTDYSLSPTDFEEVGEHVVVTLAASARLEGSDVKVEDTIYHLWRFGDGLALEAWTYSDRDDAFAAAEPDP